MLGEEKDSNTGEAQSEQEVDKKNYYEVLGVGAKADGAQISASFKKLSLIYHPDRNVGDDSAAAKLFEVNEAYQTLSDPTRRKEYDATIPEFIAVAAPEGDSASAPASENSSLVGIISNFATAVIKTAKAVPLFSAELPDHVPAAAKTLCGFDNFKSNTPLVEDENLLKRMQEAGLQNVTYTDLAPLGFSKEAKVDRLSCNYHRLEVTQELLETGFVIQCRSTSKDKFKVLVFDADGEPLFCENSRKSHDKSLTNVLMHCNTTFDTFQLNEGITGYFPVPGATAAIASTMGDSSGDSNSSADPAVGARAVAALPAVFNRIASVEASRKAFPAAGHFLIGVFGENYVGRSSYQLVAAPCKNNSPELKVMQESDAALLTMQKDLVEIKSRYLAAKAAYETMLDEVSRAEKSLDLIIQSKDLSYRAFVVESLFDCNPGGHVNVVTTTHGSLEAHAAVKARVAANPDGANTEAPKADPNAPVDTSIRTPRLRRDSFQEVTQAASVVASKASESVSQAATMISNNASQTAATYGGWVSKKWAAGASSLSRVRASFTSPATSQDGEEASSNADEASTGSTGVEKTTESTTTAVAEEPAAAATDGEQNSTESAAEESEESKGENALELVEDEEKV